jgi:transcriptional regulator with XRE-family HTH domain
MEKKTIGSFIAALRRANGMTQKELAEKLYVSDKTVSRWECDESTPELSLIPVIADIFGITSDELLRGERKSSLFNESTPETAPPERKEKSEKSCIIIPIFSFGIHKRKERIQNGEISCMLCTKCHVMSLKSKVEKCCKMLNWGRKFPQNTS